MKKYLSVMPLAFLLCFTVSCQKAEKTAEEAVVDVEAHKESITEWCDRYTSSVRAGDVDSLLALYAENIVILPPNGTIVEGRDAYRQWISGWFGNFNAEENLEIQEIKILGRYAFVRGSHNYRNVHRESGVIQEGKGTFINLFEFLPDGIWRCTHNMWTNVSPSLPKEE